jgi:hypothetical protein
MDNNNITYKYLLSLSARTLLLHRNELATGQSVAVLTGEIQGEEWVQIIETMLSIYGIDYKFFSQLSPLKQEVLCVLTDNALVQPGGDTSTFDKLLEKEDEEFQKAVMQYCVARSLILNALEMEEAELKKWIILAIQDTIYGFILADRIHNLVVVPLAQVRLVKTQFKALNSFELWFTEEEIQGKMR